MRSAFVAATIVLVAAASGALVAGSVWQSSHTSPAEKQGVVVSNEEYLDKYETPTDEASKVEVGKGKDAGYSWCSAWQDLRAILSFALGAVASGLIERITSSRSSSAPQRQEEEGAKGCTPTYLLW
mmetsp:Transcript_15926/g.34473  ORF Transcript_15926/g.34473 Transcript_15926/m.34473 type:complete len:126 (-) Transcript_15926:80-457(-)